VALSSKAACRLTPDCAKRVGGNAFANEKSKTNSAGDRVFLFGSMSSVDCRREQVPLSGRLAGSIGQSSSSGAMSG